MYAHVSALIYTHTASASTELKAMRTWPAAGHDDMLWK